MEPARVCISLDRMWIKYSKVPFSCESVGKYYYRLNFLLGIPSQGAKLKFGEREKPVRITLWITKTSPRYENTRIAQHRTLEHPLHLPAVLQAHRHISGEESQAQDIRTSTASAGGSTSSLTHIR